MDLLCHNGTCESMYKEPLFQSVRDLCAFFETRDGNVEKRKKTVTKSTLQVCGSFNSNLRLSSLAGSVQCLNTSDRSRSSLSDCYGSYSSLSKWKSTDCVGSRSTRRISLQEAAQLISQDFSHICFTYSLPNTIARPLNAEHAQLSYIGQDIHKLPSILCKIYGARVHCLDLSYNALTTLQGVEEFCNLQELILDNNTLTDGITIPQMPTLHTLSINKNHLVNLEHFLLKVQNNLPSLKYLSLLGNKACPDQLSDTSKDEDDYKRYRYYVIHALPKLQFLDSTNVTGAERQEALRRGHLMRLAKPLNASALGQKQDAYSSSPNTKFTPLPRSRRNIDDHQGAYGKCKYRYSGKHSEGNRFIQNSDL